MAQNVTPRTDPPGWRAEQNLIDWLEELAERIEPFRASVHGINDPALRVRALGVVASTTSVLAVHLPEPRDGVVVDLQGLEHATDYWRLPRFDPELGGRTETLEKLRSATGLLLRAIQDARRAAEEARGRDTISKQPLAMETAKIQAMLHRLDTVESELRRVAREKDTAPRFVQQNGLVNLYVDKMRVKLDLARLHLTIGDANFDLGALTSAVDAMGEMTARFQSAVQAWVTRVTQALTEGARTIGTAVRRVVRGAQTLGKTAMRAADPTRRRFSFEPEMVLIRPGSFIMGIPEIESKVEFGGWDGSSRPQHKVTIRRQFLLGKYPVTVGEYEEFVSATRRRGYQPPENASGRHPAVNVSFTDAVDYAAWLSRRTGLLYRLPSEAEWEYACRAGTTTARYWGDQPNQKLVNSEGMGTTKVGTYPPNPWGLHDMLGNVFEWVEDEWHVTYVDAPDDGAAWITSGAPDHRVVRGGSWNHSLSSGRSGYRSECAANARGGLVGFRLARSV